MKDVSWFVIFLILLLLLERLGVLQQKRQIFREQVSPHTGGKIPEDAFRTDRLALNRLNKEGIAVPDGVLLEARHRESHHQSHRHDPAISASIVKLVQHQDGRYAPPEGHYPFHNLIESTYIIRPPWGQAHSLVVPPHKTLQTPLILPHPHPHPPSSDDPLLAFNQLDAFYPDLHGTRIWNGFAQLFHESPARFLREAAATSKTTPADYPSLAAPPDTAFSCGSSRGKMLPDPEANCQVFHLCHTSGQKETFLCPKGMRFEAASSQCATWTKVPCGPQPL